MSKTITVRPAHGRITGEGWVAGGVHDGKLLRSDNGKAIPLNQISGLVYVGPPKSIKINEPKRKRKKKEVFKPDDFDTGAIEEQETDFSA